MVGIFWSLSYLRKAAVELRLPPSGFISKFLAFLQKQLLVTRVAMRGSFAYRSSRPSPLRQLLAHTVLYQGSDALFDVSRIKH